MEKPISEVDLWTSFERVEKEQGFEPDENEKVTATMRIEQLEEVLGWGSNPIPIEWKHKYTIEFCRWKFITSLLLIGSLILLSIFFNYQYFEYQFGLLPQITYNLAITDDLRQKGLSNIYLRIIIQTIALILGIIIILFAWLKRKKTTEWNYFKYSLRGFFIPLGYLLILILLVNIAIDLPTGYIYALPTNIYRTPLDTFLLSTILALMCPFMIINVILAKSCIRIENKAAIYLFLGWFLRVSQTGKDLPFKSIQYIHLLTKSYKIFLVSLQKGLQEYFELDLSKIDEVKLQLLKKIFLTQDINNVIPELNSTKIINFYNLGLIDLIELTNTINNITPNVVLQEYTLHARAIKASYFAGKICLFILFSAIPAIPAYFPM